MMLRRALPILLLVVAVGAWLAVPVRWRVEGLSMAPGLMPGEIAVSDWFPWLDRWRAPRRFERWTLVEPDGALAVKRVWGLPGETIAIVDGDVVVDEAVAVKPPVVLAELALPVPQAIIRGTAAAVLIAIDEPVFDDAPFAPDERRLLVPVRDVGITAIITASHGKNPPPVEVRVGGRVARVQRVMVGRFAVVAGRLDGCFVAGAWPLEGAIDGAKGAVVPRGGPQAWSLMSPWIGSEPVTTCEVVVGGARSGMGLHIEHVAVWRDMHALPPADSADWWRLSSAECLVFGDFPAGSRDSRHWGPLDVTRLQHRLATPRSR